MRDSWYWKVWVVARRLVLLGAIVRGFIWSPLLMTAILLAAVVFFWLFVRALQKRTSAKGGKDSDEKYWPVAAQPEGTVCAIGKGKKFVRARLSMPGFHFDPAWEIVEGRNPLQSLFWHPWSRFFGNLFLISLWSHIRIRSDVFTYFNPGPERKLEQKGPTNVRFWLVKKDLYGFRAPVVDRNNMALIIEGFIQLEICNGYKPFYLFQNWLEAVMERVLAETFEFFTGTTYDEVKDRPESIGEQLLAYMTDPAIRGGDKIEEIRREIGVRISKILVTRPIFDPAELARLQVAWAAEQDAVRTERAGQAEGTKTEREAAGRAAAYQILRPIMEDPNLKPLVLMDALKKGGGAGGGDAALSLLLILPQIQDLLRGGGQGGAPVQPQPQPQPQPARIDYEEF